MPRCFEERVPAVGRADLLDAVRGVHEVVERGDGADGDVGAGDVCCDGYGEDRYRNPGSQRRGEGVGFLSPDEQDPSTSWRCREAVTAAICS